ncbi:MAG: hypothetical protein HQK52_20515 [Oligoflexia bacterium]|nr:hypothetical protein [Oligoflexia bacterium]
MLREKLLRLFYPLSPLESKVVFLRRSLFLQVVATVFVVVESLSRGDEDDNNTFTTNDG